MSSDEYARGFAAGMKAERERQRVIEDSPETFRTMHQNLLDLERENARLVAKLRGYVIAGSARGPDVLVRHGTASARGVNRESYKPRHRKPFVLDAQGNWKRARGRLRVEDYATRLPPKVCEHCGSLFVTARRDARTCSTRCRTARHRAR